MLVPDNIHPEQTIYFNGAIVLQVLQEHQIVDMLDLYARAKGKKQMSMPVFALCLDWLYLLNLVSIDVRGQVKLCS